jgi:amino acid permease|tara:strand:- start:756 stop:989 length:234 start_codon:yes stop_codon:yes gene_type:complete
MMLIEVIGGIIQWVIFPILYLQYTFYQQLKKQDKELAVLQAKSEVQTQSTDRELKEIKQTVDRIFQKLDSLENNLRK